MLDENASSMAVLEYEGNNDESPDEERNNAVCPANRYTSYFYRNTPRKEKHTKLVLKSMQNGFWQLVVTKWSLNTAEYPPHGLSNWPNNGYYKGFPFRKSGTYVCELKLNYWKFNKPNGTTSSTRTSGIESQETSFTC